MTLAIAHREGDRAVLDALRERRPPFSPDDVVQGFSALLDYGVSVVRGDRYGGEWPREHFWKAGISYDVAELSKSDLYRTFLPAVNSGRVELLDHRILRAQLEGPEHRTARGGRDSIDHPPGGKDDVANAGAGAPVAAMEGFELRREEPEDGEPLHAWAPEVLAHEAREQRRSQRHRPDLGPIPDAVC